MESISKKGKTFTGKFASTAIRIGLAKPFEDTEEVIPSEETNEPVDQEPGVEDTVNVPEPPVKAEEKPIKKVISKKAKAPKKAVIKKVKK